MGDHKRFSPSAATQWINCPASIPLSEGLPDNGSEFSSLGDAAHALARRCITLGIEPRELIGETITGHEIDEETAGAVTEYVDLVSRLMAEHPDCIVNLEIPVDSDIDDEFGGTADCVIHAENLLIIVDYKHGVGVSVDAEDNDQLYSYALCAHRDEDEIHCYVVQPRDFHGGEAVRGPVKLTPADLDKFALEITAGIQRVETATSELLATLNAGEEPSASLFTTGDHCRWCRARAVCPAQYQEVMQETLADFTRPAELQERLVEVLNRADQARKYLKAVEAFAQARAMEGADVPGFKLVRSVGSRKWIHSDAEHLKKLRNNNAKIGKKGATETRCLSPAQMDKAFPELNQFFATLWEKPEGGLRLVSTTDKRVAVKAATPEDDFKPVKPKPSFLG